VCVDVLPTDLVSACVEVGAGGEAVYVQDVLEVDVALVVKWLLFDLR
jgi:hypothetical protein